MSKFRAVDAMREHMFEGNPVSLIEAILLFGVQNPNAEFTRIRKDGFVMKSQKVAMTKLLTRINKFAHFEPPADLPHKEITMTEYWIER
ncbi:hypothetical protein N9D70_00885 [bacterium]|nr:hypothetical protein [bacterium]